MGLWDYGKSIKREMGQLQIKKSNYTDSTTIKEIEMYRLDAGVQKAPDTKNINKGTDESTKCST